MNPGDMKTEERNNSDFQTPGYLCDYMASFLPGNPCFVCEPTKGAGNLVQAIRASGHPNIFAPDDIFRDVDMYDRFDWVVMNPPFTPMKVGYEILDIMMEKSDNIIALMPWLTLINSQKRTDKLKEFGLKKVIHLPRKVFNGSRVQTCLILLNHGYSEATLLDFYEIPKV